MTFRAKFASKASSGDFVHKIIRDKALVCLLNFPVGAKRAWYVLHVESAKLKAFNDHMTKPVPIELTDYGTILHSGWGEAPSNDLKAELREKYGLFE